MSVDFKFPRTSHLLALSPSVGMQRVGHLLFGVVGVVSSFSVAVCQAKVIQS